MYEIAVLYPYPLSQKEEQQAQKDVEAIFSDVGGMQMVKDVWGRRGLAYPVEGRTEGSFIIYYYEMAPAKLKEVDHALRIAPGVLRHMIIKPPKGYIVVQYGELYEKWMKERENVEEVRKREREESLQKRVADKAKRQVKRADEEKKKVVEEKKPMEKADISKELDKLISDDDLLM